MHTSRHVLYGGGILEEMISTVPQIIPTANYLTHLTLSVYIPSLPHRNREPYVMPTLLSLVAPDVVVMITYGAGSDDNVGIMYGSRFSVLLLFCKRNTIPEKAFTNCRGRAKAPQVCCSSRKCINQWQYSFQMNVVLRLAKELSIASHRSRNRRPEQHECPCSLITPQSKWFWYNFCTSMQLLLLVLLNPGIISANITHLYKELIPLFERTYDS